MPGLSCFHLFYSVWDPNLQQGVTTVKKAQPIPVNPVSTLSGSWVAVAAFTLTITINSHDKANKAHPE